MSAHDRYLANYHRRPVRIECRECGHSWDGDQVEEYGAAWFEPHEDCPSCGSTELDAADLDALDIEERRLEARGIDF